MKYIKIINKNFYSFKELFSTNLFYSLLWIFDYKNIYIEIENNNINLTFLKKVFFIKYLWYEDFSNIETIQFTKNFDKFFDIQFVETNSAIKLDKNSLLVTKDQFIFDQIYFRNLHKYNYLFFVNLKKKSIKEREKHRQDLKEKLEKNIEEIRKKLKIYI